jgi:hypothetical protein
VNLRHLLGIALVFMLPSLALAQTTYYVDPQFTGGTRTGTITQPWNSLVDTVSNTPWTQINTALGSGAVTIYYSARLAESDANQTSTVSLALERTDLSANFLTFDGMSKYQTNTTHSGTPSWSNYNTSPVNPKSCVSNCSVFQITASIALDSDNVNATPAVRKNIIVHGFKFIEASNGTSIVHLFASNGVTIEYSEFTASVTQMTGPGVLTGKPGLLHQLHLSVQLHSRDLRRVFVYWWLIGRSQLRRLGLQRWY